jgi:hypothetical protein
VADEHWAAYPVKPRRCSQQSRIGGNLTQIARHRGGWLPQPSKVGDAGIHSRRGTRIGMGQRGQGGGASRASPAHDESGGVGVPAAHEFTRGKGTVFDVDDSPLAVHVLAVGAAVAGGATAVDIGHAETAAGEEHGDHVQQPRPLGSGPGERNMGLARRHRPVCADGAAGILLCAPGVRHVR